jgi:hypothetical protein
MSFFSGTNNLDPSSKLPFFPVDFNGLLRIDKCKGIEPRDGGKAFIVEFTVFESNLPEVSVGSRRSWYQKIPVKDVETAHGACIAFLYAALGLDSTKDKEKIEADIKPKQDEWLNKLVNEDPKKGPVNIAAGEFVRLQTFNKKKKKDGSDFTVHTFSPGEAPASDATAAA